MLSISSLYAKVAGTAILKNISLEIPAGKVVVIMGHNGSGKSSLARVIAGDDAYTVTRGSISFLGKSITKKTMDERARAGIFLGYQQPVALPGVSFIEFMKAAMTAKAKEEGAPLPDVLTLTRNITTLAAPLGIGPAELARGVNEDFSGGERKKCELLQMLLLKPQLSILDEIDSGVDVDALKLIGTHIARYRSKERSIVLITHYPRLLKYIPADTVHVCSGGKLVATGGKKLINDIEKNGYARWS